MTRDELWKFDLARYHQCKSAREHWLKCARVFPRSSGWWKERALVWETCMENIQALWPNHKME